MGFEKFKTWCKENVSSLLIILSAILGLICGFILKSLFTISPLMLTYIALPGTLIIRAFLMIIVPLIVASLATSITGTKQGENKRLIVWTFVLIILFISFCSTFGTLMVALMKPGVRDMSSMSVMDRDDSQQPSLGIDMKQIMSSQDDSIYDTFMNLIPDNIIAAAFTTYYTALVPIDKQNQTLGYKKVAERAFKPNMLGLCVFSLILGFAVLQLDSKANTIRLLLHETNAVAMHILSVLIRVMPIGMFFWMCVQAIKMKSPEKILGQLAWFYGVVFFVYGCFWFVFYPIVYFLITRKNIFKMYANIIPAMIVAFGSCSSALTLPVTMKCNEEKNNLSPIVSQFVLPLAMTIHMPGAGTYYPMVSLFVAQMHGMDITFQMIASLVIFCVILSMAMPATPAGGSSLVFYISTCALIGIDNPMDVLAYTISIEWLMEPIRTTTNITGDSVIAHIVQKLCKL